MKNIRIPVDLETLGERENNSQNSIVVTVLDWHPPKLNAKFRAKSLKEVKICAYYKSTNSQISINYKEKIVAEIMAR